MTALIAFIVALFLFLISAACDFAWLSVDSPHALGFAALGLLATVFGLIVALAWPPRRP